MQFDREISIFRCFGRLVTDFYPDGSTSVVLVDSDGFVALKVSADLSSQGLRAPNDWFFVKNYSEYLGLPDALVEAGVCLIEGWTHFGPFDANAALMRFNYSTGSRLLTEF